MSRAHPLRLDAEDLVDSLPAAIAQAADRLQPYVRKTPVEPFYEALAPGAAVHLKLENTQLTGSFKLRGACNKLLSLTAEELASGVVAASTGNHGMAVACAASRLGTQALIFVPHTSRATKLAGIRRFGGEIRKVGDDCVEAERAAREHAAEHGLTYVSPYNDAAVIAGQGTIGLELSQQLGELDTVYIALGGGGLLSGVAAYLRSLNPGIEVVACSPERSAVMRHSIEAGRLLQIESKETLSDGTAGGVEPGAITFELCRRLVDRSLLISEEEIADGVRRIVGHHHTLIEGSAGVAVAGLLQDRDRLSGRRAAVVLCGANIAAETLAAVLGSTG